MTAAELRCAGLLWPQDLSDENLRLELAQCDRDVNLLSYRMLVDEWKRRWPSEPPVK